MNKEKILIYVDNKRAADFERYVYQTIDRANQLINAWHTFQPWNIIQTYDQAIELIKDPGAAMDKVLINAIDIKIVGNLKIKVESVADMLNIDRESWLNLVEGKPIKETCQPCKKTTIRKGQTAIRLDEFMSYADFITWSVNHFIADEAAIIVKKESFRIYAESKSQIELNTYWQNVVGTLNSLIDKNYLSIEALKMLQKNLKGIVRFSYETNKLHLDEEMLLNEILKIK